MATPARARRRRDTGQVLVIFVLALVALMGAAGLAFDIGRFYSERRFLQNAADAAALAAGETLAHGGTQDAARIEARAVLSRNYSVPPNGLVPALPPADGSEVYASGHAGDPSYLIDGILFSGGSVRVAVRNTIPYTFGRAIGLTDNMIVAQARVKFDGDLLPIAVRNFVNPPGPSGLSSPCSYNDHKFMDFFSTAATACLGTDTDNSLRTDPSVAAPGPTVVILGQGAQPGNGADFRGFAVLDIRNYSNTTSQVYFNKVPPGTTSSTLKDLEARWIYTGGYPGPGFPAVVSPPDPYDQVGILSGNSTGAAIDAFDDRFAIGDRILVCVYSGMTSQIPDFQMNAPSGIALPTTGTVASVGSIKVSRNQSFSGTVTLTTVGDPGDPMNPMTNGTLLGGATPITYSPNPVTPTLGSGTTVTLSNATTSGATAGVYTIWQRGEAGSPYLSVKYLPVAVTVGSVNHDFDISGSLEGLAPTLGSDATWTLTLARSGSGSFGSDVTLSLEALPGETLPAGLGAVSFSANPVTIASSGTDVTLTVNSGTLAAGQYNLVVRATGLNADSPNRQVTHLFPVRLLVATGSTASNTDYVDITGFAVMQVASINSNSVSAFALTPVIPDLSDSRLRLGQVARLAPWN
jgi:hypothetical protein